MSEFERVDELPPLSTVQARRTELIYKKAEYLTTPQEDDELDYLNKTLEDWYGCA